MRWFIRLIVAVLLVTVMAGCSNGKESAQNTEEKETKEEARKSRKQPEATRSNKK